MTCYSPWWATRIPGGISANLNHPKAIGKEFQLPCGNCVGCRIQRSKDWATRIYHEASCHEANSFLTLTYNDECLPSRYSVSVRELQLFMKRVRNAGHKVRFFGCGEYGDANFRPHYHVMIFGYDFPDKTLWAKSKSGEYIYTSKELETLWPYGWATIGAVTLASAGYIARYVMKKINGKQAEDHYQRINPYTGELVRVTPEFITMSTRPGLGHEWFTKYATDAFPSDFLIVDGRKRAVPRYYLKLLGRLDEQTVEEIKMERAVKAVLRQDDDTPQRLETRAEVQTLRAKRLKRDL